MEDVNVSDGLEQENKSGIKKIKLIGLILGAIATILFTAGMTRGVGATGTVDYGFAKADTINGSSEVCKDSNVSDDLKEAAGCKTTDKDVPKRVADIINIFISIIGVLAVIMIIYGGISLVLSLGNAEKVKKAKNIILYSAIGLLVVLVAFAIVNFVLDNVLD